MIFLQSFDYPGLLGRSKIVRKEFKFASIGHCTVPIRRKFLELVKFCYRRRFGYLLVSECNKFGGALI